MRSMNSSTDSFQSRRRMIYTFVSFLCFVFFLFCYNQRQLLEASFSGDLEAHPSLNLDQDSSSSRPSVDSSKKTHPFLNLDQDSISLQPSVDSSEKTHPFLNLDKDSNSTQPNVDSSEKTHPSLNLDHDSSSSRPSVDSSEKTHPSLNLDQDSIASQPGADSSEKTHPSLNLDQDSIASQPSVDSSENHPSLNLDQDSSSSQPSLDSSEKAGSLMNVKCDIFEGMWVYDPDAYPLYRASQCPFLSEQVSCQKNGRPDSNYECWRWEPTGCQIPRFNVTNLLEILRGKHVMIVGDSLNLNQWESLACILYSSLAPSRVSIDMRRRIFRATDYDCSVEFNVSPFLVKLGRTEGGKKVLNLDEISDSARLWKDADVIVFNSGHWWTHSGRFRSWDFFEHGGELVKEMDRDDAFKTGLKTWAQWVDSEVDPFKTQVIFRSISPEHKVEHHCQNQTSPITDETYIQRFPKSMIEIVERILHEMRTPVKYLNITHLSEYRREAHPSVYALQERAANRHLQLDCSHWCLPGLPDTWNVLTYISIMENLSKS